MLRDNGTEAFLAKGSLESELPQGEGRDGHAQEEHAQRTSLHGTVHRLARLHAIVNIYEQGYKYITR